MQESGDGGGRIDIDREVTRARLIERLFGAESGGPRLGRFELVKSIGSGSMGVVYEARDSQSGKQVAVKILPHLDGRALARFKHEFRSLCDVRHPNLVELYEFFGEAGHWFFSMELVAGASFTRWVRPGDRLDQPRLRAALVQLAIGLDAIHAAGKLHCDVKPSNVLVSREGRVALLDFGLATELGQDDAASLRTGPLGTPAFVAPERAEGAAAQRASDWYAVGVMLFEALTGELPFTGGTREVLRQKQSDDAPDPRERVPDLPGDLSELCSGLLRRRPSARLDSSAVFALASAGQKPVAASVPAIARTPFLGRAPQLAQLEQALTRVRAGSAVSLLIGGGSGIGKSALLGRFVKTVGEDVLLLHGRCHQHESLPYKVFDAVMDALALDLRKRPDTEVRLLLPRHVDALQRLFPVLGQVDVIRRLEGERASGDARMLRNRAFAALRELLFRLSDRVPVVLVVDDLQWGDADSARMLAHVLGPPDPPPVLFVGAYRSEEVASSEFLSRVLDPAPEAAALDNERLALGPLEPEIASQLAGCLLNTASHADAAAIAADAQGIPLLIGELAEYINTRAGSVQEPVKVSLEQLILERVTQLPDAARRVLEVLAIAAGPIELALLAEAAETDAAAALQALRAARFVRVRGQAASDSVEPYHDRIRESVAASLDPTTTRARHAQIVAAMQRRGVNDPERRLLHLEGAGEHELAATAALDAARLATAQLAFNRAAELLRKAIALHASDHASLHLLQRELGDALANAGRGAEAARAYLSAAQALPADEARRQKRMAARQFLRSGQLEQGTALASELLQQHRISIAGGEAVLIAKILWSRALTRLTRSSVAVSEGRRHAAQQQLETLAALQDLIVGHPLQGFLLHSKFMHEAQRGGSGLQRLQAFAWEAYHCAAIGGARQERAAEKALAVAASLRDAIATPYAHAMVQMAEASAHLFSGRFALGIAAADRATRSFDQCSEGWHFERSWTAAMRFACFEFTGDLSELAGQTSVLAREAEERDDQSAIGLLTLAYPLACLAGDAPEASLEFLARMKRRLGTGLFTSFHYFAVHRSVDTLLYQGQGVAAFELLSQRWRDINSWYISRGMFMKAAIHYMRARAALSAFRETRDPRCLSTIRADIAVVDRLGHGFGGGALALRAVLHHFEGEAARADRALQEAVLRFNREGADRLGLLAALLRGRVKGGAEGDEIARVAAFALEQHGIRRPERMLAAHLVDIAGA